MTTELNCSFCGKSRNEVKKIIAGPSSYICNECISISHKIINEPDVIDDFDPSDIPTPAEIKEHLDKVVISQEDAKELLSVVAYNHYKRIYFSDSDVPIEKSNVIMLGTTGSGKTLLAKTLAKKLNVPFTIADATTLTEAGYVGEDVESVIERLLNQCEWDIPTAQKGIVFIDEIDKKARSSEANTNTKDISGEGVQQALLRLIEGTTIKVPTPGNSKRYEFTEVDTTDILFICSGAFVGIDKTVNARVKKQNIGFGSDLNKKSDQEWQDVIDHSDLISYGLIPELVGRLPNLVTLSSLTVDNMVSILKDSDASIIPQVKKLLEIDNIEVEFSDQYFQDVASLASKNKLGARSLKSIVENSLHNIMFRAPDLRKNGVKRVSFETYPSKNVDTNPLFLYNNGNQEVDKLYKIRLRG